MLDDIHHRSAHHRGGDAEHQDTVGRLQRTEQGAELNLSYAFVWMGDMPVSQNKGLNGRISTSGEFADAAIHVLSSSITWRY